MPGSRLSILIPVYNEMETIERVVRAAARAPLPDGVERELIVVDDGSVDQTGRVLAGLDPALAVRVVRLERNRGKGAAIREGIRHARGDWILIQDGDLEYDPSCYHALVDPLARGSARVVYGSRFLGTIERMGWQYRLVNRLLVLWTNALYRTRITDEATAYKAFQADLLKSMQLRCRRFEFCPEVTGKLCRRGIPIHEVPVRYLGRTKAEGKKIRWYDAVVAFAVLLRERFARAPDPAPSRNAKMTD
jgi:dolichol-phosphate mannosyltransferase